MIERDYYRKVDRDAAARQSLDGAVESLDDRFSHYFDAEGLRGVPARPPRASSRASA